MLLDLRADGLDLVHALRNEALTAEARLYGHDEHHVAVRQQREQRLRRSFRLDDTGRLDACRADLLQLLEGVAVGLIVHGDDVRACLDEVVEVLIRVGDHQMYVEDLVGRLAQALDDRRADGDVRYEMTVHYVNVNVLRACIGRDLDVACQIGEVSGQNRR